MMSEARFYLKILLRRLPLVILIVIATTAAAVLYALSLPRTFTSSARLLVEAPQVTEGLSSSTVQTVPLAMMNTVQQKVMARDSLLALEQRHDMVDVDGLPQEEVAGLVASSVSMRSAVAAIGDLNVITTVSANAATPEKAAEIAQDIVDQIMTESTRQRTQVASSTLSFIQAEVERLSEELEQRGKAIMDFKIKNAGALPDGLEYRENRRSALQTDLLNARSSLEALEEQERSIRALAQTGTDGNALQTQLETVREELSAARLLFSETNPRVTRLVRQEEQIQERIRAAAAAEPAEQPAQGTGNVIADMQLADLNQRRRALEERIPVLNAELEELSKAIEATPANATALAGMERELEAAQSRYDSARARLVLAQSGERLEQSDQAQRITVLESPSVPSWPSKPNRKLIVAAGLAAGLGLAGGLVVLLELLGGRVRRSSDLVQALEITPIVTIPLLPSKARG